MFDFNKFVDGKLAAKFWTEDTYKKFMTILEQDFPEVRWRDGTKPNDKGMYAPGCHIWCNYTGDEEHMLSRYGTKSGRPIIEVTVGDLRGYEMKNLTIGMLKTGDILVMENDYPYKYGMLLKDTSIGAVIRWDPDKQSGVCYSKEIVTNALEKVKRVERPTVGYRFCTFEPNIKNKIIWERKNVKELTVEEIEKLLGYKIKVVADEEG